MSTAAAGSRKRRRAVIDEDTDTETIPMSTVILPPDTSEASDDRSTQLTAFREVDAAIRSILTCKICVRILYEPYMLGCGHVHCYSCLCQWFESIPSRKKTCPDCRTAVTEPPAPAYAIRDIVQEITRRQAILPHGETVAEHKALQEEELGLVEAAKQNTDAQVGGLFGGMFKPSLRYAEPIYDEDDHIHRCPSCLQEFVYDEVFCGNCGWKWEGYDGAYSDTEGGEDLEGQSSADSMDSVEEDEDELDGDFEMHDREFDETMDMTETGYSGYTDGSVSPQASNGRTWPSWSLQVDPPRYGSESEHESELSSIGGFVVDDDEEEDLHTDGDATEQYESESDDYQDAPVSQSQRARRRIVIEDSASEDPDDSAEETDPSAPESGSETGTETGSNDSDVPVITGIRRRLGTTPVAAAGRLARGPPARSRGTGLG